jgi:hypothetical protein
VRIKIEHRIGVRAPIETVWGLISDLEGWPRWNRLYPKVKGALRIGAQLELEVAIPGQAPRTIRPVIADWVPNEQILWRLSMFAGLVKSTRYLEIEQLTPGSCIFSNGEMFEGLLGENLPKRLRGPIREGFRTMGEAVKALAETEAGAAEV